MVHYVHEATPTELAALAEVKKLRRQIRWLIAAVGVLAVISLGLAALVVFEEEGAEPLTVEQERMLESIDAYLAGWTAGDVDAMAAVMAPDGYFSDDLEKRLYMEDSEFREFVGAIHSLGFAVSRSDAAFVNNVVLVTQEKTNGGPSPSPGVFIMSHDGTQILAHIAL